MCATMLGRRHLVNAYEVNAGWLIPFVDKRVWAAGKTVRTPCHSVRCHAAGHCSCSLSVSVGQSAFHFIFFHRIIIKAVMTVGGQR